jgi:hypothetical protein
VAGRPKKRAAELAKGATADAAPPSWGDEVAQLLAKPPAPAPAPPAITVPTSREQTRVDISTEVQRSDRQSLATWWREQIVQLEKEHQERVETLSGAGEHPSAAYASQVRKFGALGMPVDAIAILLGVPETVLLQHYESDWRIGESLLIAPVAANLFRIATSGNDRVAYKAAIDILNRRGGEEWRPPAQKLEIDDSRKNKTRVIDSSKLTFEQRQQLRAIILDHSADNEARVVQTGGLVPAGAVTEDADEDSSD